MKVVIGTNSLSSGGEHLDVEEMIIHENYNSHLITNDVSLVKVTKDIEFNDRVQPIKLPEADTGAGADLVLTGWGRLSVRIIFNHVMVNGSLIDQVSVLTKILLILKKLSKNICRIRIK